MAKGLRYTCDACRVKETNDPEKEAGWISLNASGIWGINIIVGNSRWNARKLNYDRLDFCCRDHMIKFFEKVL